MRTHGDRYNDNSPYSSWHAMKNRCLNKKGPDYKYYGGKGLKIYTPWLEYINFREWALANGWLKGLTLERMDSHRGYYPDNCKWVDRAENAKRAREEKLYNDRL